MATTYPGTCFLCQKEITRRGASRHIASCLASSEEIETPPPSKKGRSGSSKHLLYHLFIQGKYEPEYWINIEVAGSTKLSVLDGFLRDLWLECCGHLSAFEIHGARYDCDGGGAFDEETYSMDCKIQEVLEEKDSFEYEYDFGSTTHLQLKVVSLREGKKGKEKVRLLARNHPPSIPCAKCKKKEAEAVCTECIYEGKGWLCEGCAKKHPCGLEMSLPVVNSPRVGVCGYTGEE